MQEESLPFCPHLRATASNTLTSRLQYTFVDDLGLQFETEMTGYFWFVCNTFSLGTFRTKVAFCGKHSHCPATIMRTATRTFDPEESIRFVLNTVPSPFRIYATFKARYDEFILQTSSNHNCLHISLQISSNGSREAIKVSVTILRMSDKLSVEKPGLRKTFLTKHCQQHILCLWFRASLICMNNCPTRCNTKQSIYYSASTLYMFLVSTTPIIRSTQNCNYSLRYCAAPSLQRGQAWPRWREVAVQHLRL